MDTPASRIRQRRQELEMSQEELALLIGKDQKQVWRYETGHSSPTGDVLIALAKALGTTSDWLLGLTDIAERPLRTQADLSDDERALIELYRRKPPEKRRQVMEVAKVL